MNLKYFKLSEFDVPSKPGSGRAMQATTLAMLEHAREIAGIPFVINSGYRTPEHNAKIGGSPTSSHMLGYAVDIRCTALTRNTIVQALHKAGFKRIGIAKNFIHADNDPQKKPALWYYNPKITNVKPEWA